MWIWRRRRLRAQHVVRSKKNVSRGERDECVGANASLSKLYSTRLDLAVVAHLVAEPEERVLDHAPHLGDRVEMPERQLLARQRHVDDLVAQPPVELLAAEPVAALGDRRLEPLADPVQQHAALAVAHAAQRLGELATCARGTARARRRARGSPAAAAIAAVASLSYAVQSTAATLSIAILLRSRVGTSRPRCERRRAASATPRLEHRGRVNSVDRRRQHHSGKIAADVCLRPDRAPLRPVVAERRRGRRVLRRGGGRLGGPVVELGVGTGGSRSRSRRRASRDRRRHVAGHARGRRGAGARSRASTRSSTCGSATCASRPSSGTLPLVICPFRSLLHMETDADRRAALRAIRRAARARRPLRLRRVRARRRRHRGDGRPLARARARHLGARGLGRGLAHARVARPRRRGTSRRCRSRGSRSASGAPCWPTRASSSTRSTAGSTARPWQGGEDSIWVCRARS